MLSAKRWSGPEALAAGIVNQTHSPETLFAETLKFAEQQAKLGANRKIMASMKGRIKGHVARGIFEFCFYGPQSSGKPQSGPTALSPGLEKLKQGVASGPAGAGASMAALLSNSAELQPQSAKL